MPLHIQLGGGQKFRQHVTLVELGRLFDLVHQGLRHRLVGLIVHGIVREYRRVERPMLVELRREFDEVACDVGARQSRVALIGKQPMQGVAEFMEHRRHVVERDERRLARRRLGEVGDIVDHRFGAQQLGLPDEVIHPGAAGFVVTLEVIEIHQAQRGAVLVGDFEDAHVRLIDRDVLALFERQTIELVGCEKHTVLEHIVEFEIRLDLIFIQVVLRLADLLGVHLPVPRRELEMLAALEVLAALVDDHLNVLGFAARFGCGGGHQLREKRLHRGRCFRHLVVEHIRGIVWEPEQRGLLRTKLRDCRDRVARVVGVAFFGTRPGMFEQLLARGAIA